MIAKLLLINALALFVYMTAWFFVAKQTKKISMVDVVWGGGFLMVAWIAAVQHPSARAELIAILVTLWAVRIMSHLGRRVLHSSDDDPRYVELSKKWKGNFWLRTYGSIFLLQGFIIMLVTLPVVAAVGEQNPDLAGLSVLGAAFWAVGFMVEMHADKQLRVFLADTKNKGKVMDQGLWKYSRHPNYFGELLQWWAIALIALQTHGGWLGLLGPLTLTILIVFVSGIPPIEKKKKSDPTYAAYMKRTSPLILWPPKHSAQ
jgi:steroid 5-alpha reductase family enzyme